MIDKKAISYSEELKKLGIEHQMLEHPQLISVDAVQKYLGYGMEDAGSTLMMKADGSYIAVMRRSDTKLDNEKLRKKLGVKNLSMVTEEEFVEITHSPVGAGPVYIPGIDLFIDKNIFEKEYINAGSGSLLVTVRYKTRDLLKIPGVKVADITTSLAKEKNQEIDIRGKRILSGITPSGDGTLHIGNYLGAVKQFIEFAKDGECYLMVADMHALTTVQKKEQLQRNIESLILNELALLGDLTNITFFRQSDVPMHTELTWVFDAITPIGLLKRAHAYKDKLEKNIQEDEINLGLFTYPILMATDILLYKPDFVPVGRDQKQHVEICRDIAERFNKIFKRNVFPLPEPYIPQEVAVVMGTDGKRKMSKSLGNYISIFEGENIIKKQVMGTYTDPTRIHPTDPGHIEGNMVFAYLDFFGEKVRVEEYKKLYQEGKVGDVEVKNYLFESLMKHFQAARLRYQELKSDPGRVKKILQEGAEKARKAASETMIEVREAIGLTNEYSFFSY